MTIINQPNYPVGSRLLIAWMIKAQKIQTATWSGYQSAQDTWEENDQVAEVEVVEYSPSGKFVRVSSPGGENFMHTPTNGWYPTMRIVVKEVLNPKDTP